MAGHVTTHNTSTIAHAHSSEHNEHYSPQWLTDLSREVVGGFTFDPFSSAVANRTVKASCYCTIAWGSKIWRIPWTQPDADAIPSRAWVNPPGGRLYRKTLEALPRNENDKQGGAGVSSAGAGFAKTSHEWALGHVDCALFLCFSLNVFRTAQSRVWAKHFPFACAPTSFPFVVFRERIQFDTVDEFGNVQHGAGGGAPQDSALVLLPTRDVQEPQLKMFKQGFSAHGHVRL